MGPLPFSSGNPRSVEQERRVVAPASMGPLPFSSGNIVAGVMASVGETSFNGAAAFQQRKLPEAVSRFRDWTRFNGAAAFQQRKLVDPLIIRTPCHCFNGAAAFQQRK